MFVVDLLVGEGGRMVGFGVRRERERGGLEVLLSQRYFEPESDMLPPRINLLITFF